MKLLLTILSWLVLTLSYAQSTEAVHVHFDKDIYLPGETVWFKAYIYNNNVMATTSTNFYAALYNEEGKLLEQKLYPIINGSCNGDFSIADSMTSGKLQFKAFTKGMLLSDSSNVFERILTLYNKDDQRASNREAIERTINLRFFPEGGNWVAGINNYIAYKAWYDDGSPAEIRGTIMDEQAHTVIDSFSTNKLGLGSLKIMPEEKQYTALWKTADGKSSKTELPAVIPSGIVLHAELVKNKLFYVISKNNDEDHLKKLHLLAQMGDEELYKADLLIADKLVMSNSFIIDSLPSGIVQLTLFDNNWNPLQQRIVFINGGTQRKPYLNMGKTDLNAKAKNIIELVMQDTMLTDLSASIADINFYNKENKQTIKQDLWFNAQLKGLNSNIRNEIETGDNSSIDLIMQTHGWRRYNWKNVIDKKETSTAALDNYLSLEISYKEKKYALPKDESLTLIVSDKGTGKQFYTVKPADQSSFVQSGLIFYDSARVQFQVKNKKEIGDDLSVIKNDMVAVPAMVNPLRNYFLKDIAAGIATNATFDSLVKIKAKKFGEMQTIKEVVVKTKYVNPITKRIQELDSEYASGTFRGIGIGSEVNVLDDEKAWGFPDVYAYIENKIPILKVVTTFSTKYLVTRNSKGDIPKIFINESESPEGVDMLSSISMSEVAYIKYHPGVTVTSMGTFAGGAVYVYLKKGTEKERGPNTMRSKMIKGYDVPKEFFNPDYTEKSSLVQQDLRTTVYWNPYIITDKQNPAIKMEYYNNDVSKKLLLTIEGINAAGDLIHIEKMIE